MVNGTEVPSTIIHLSDFHIKSKMYTTELSIIQEEKTYLNNWIDKIKRIFPEGNYLLFVSGDLTDRSEDDEIEEAKETLNKIINDLKIDKKNVIICPGNHDFNWTNFARALRKKGIKKPEDFKNHNDIKLKEFSEFYNNFFKDTGKKEFDPEKAIFDTIVDNKHKIVYLALNSLYQESQMENDHYGYFNYNSLVDELNELDRQFKDYDKIAIMHHMPLGVAEEGNFIKDWDSVFAKEFRDHRIKAYFCGHIHSTNSTLREAMSKENIVSVGSFGIKYNDPSFRDSFNTYEWGKTKEGSEGFWATYYLYEKPYGRTPYWQNQNENSDLLPFVSIRNKTGDAAALAALKQNADVHEKKELPKTNQSEYKQNHQQEEVDFGLNTTVSDYITKVIKENNLYKSGHYHWSKWGRSHSFIKTQYFFEKHECLERIKICYLKAIDRSIEVNCIRTDLLIGYSMQGCIIGTLIAIQKGWKFTFFPEIDKIYAENERILPTGDYTSITVLIDMVYTFNIIKRIIDVLKEKYEKLETVNFFSLFYSKKPLGRENPDVDKDIKDYNKSNDYIQCTYHKGKQEVKIRFTFIQETCINGCPFKKVEDCLIYNQQLDTIHKLYSEEKK